jgi:hypothetical protein
MFVKLNFTANKSFHHIKQILNAIINDPAINSVGALTTAAASWNTAITASIDYSTTEIIRTVEPTTVKSHMADNSASLANPVWTLEFQAYDAPTRKYYISFDSTTNATGVSNNSTTRIRIGDTILSGSMSSGQSTMSVDLNTAANTSGTPVILSGTAPAQLFVGNATLANNNQYESGANHDNIRTFWMYLTNDCLIVAHTGAASSNLGFNASYTNSVNYTGPYIFSQYTRYDYHNSNANGVIPLMFTNTRRGGPESGFGVGQSGTADWARIENVNVDIDCAFRVFNMVDAHVQVGSSWPLVSFPQVHWGSGSRNTEQVALTGLSSVDTSGATSGQWGRLIHTTVGTRYPSNDLRTVGYGMLPLKWSNSWRGNRGGNATTRGGFYIFNGDYFPGDTFIHNNKTYIVWPTYRGFTERVGIAVPKE